MSEEANVNGDPAVTDPQQDQTASSPEELVAEVENLKSQLKGQQRTNERLRNDLRSGIQTEAIQREQELTREALDALIDTIGSSPLLDEDVAAKFNSLKEQTARVREELSSETSVRGEIADVLGKYGLDWEADSPKVEVLRAHYDAGNFDKVRESLRKIDNEFSATDVETRAQARAEEILRGRGVKVDAGSGTGTPPTRQADILGALERGDLSGEAALTAAIELAQKDS